MRQPLPSTQSRWKRGRPVTASEHWRATHNESPRDAPANKTRPSGDVTIQDERQKQPTLTTNAHFVQPVLAYGDIAKTSHTRLQDSRLWDSEQDINFAEQELDQDFQASVRASGHSSETGSFNKARYVAANTIRHWDPSERSALGLVGGLQEDYRPSIHEKENTRHDSSLQQDQLFVTASGSEYFPSQVDDDASIEETKSQDEDTDEDGMGQRNEEEGEGEDIEEHIPLTYQIPDVQLRAAMSASPNTRSSYWSTKLYRGKDDASLLTHYCRTFEVSERVAQYFVEEKVVGFDIEWRPFSNEKSIKQNASLIQLACENRIALFHIAQFEGTTIEQLVPSTLRYVLESPEILKVGVSIKSDFSRIRKFLNIQPRGIFELSRLHNLVEWYATDPSKVSNRLVSLAKQVHQHLQLPLYKGGDLEDDPDVTTSVRNSDWSKPLDPQQIHYAAADAYAGFRLYHMLEWKRKQLRPTPARPQVCDYDNSPTPRSKASQITVKTIAKASDVADDNEIADQQQEEKEEEEEEEEDSDSDEDDGNYLTAPEDSSVSQGVLRSQQAENEQYNRVKRVGRVNWSPLDDSKVTYPTLPEIPDDNGDVVLTTQCADQSLDLTVQQRKVTSNSDTRSTQSYTGTDDEDFSDPDLEAAFAKLDIDADGTLRSKLSSSLAALDNNGGSIQPASIVDDSAKDTTNPTSSTACQVTEPSQPQTYPNQTFIPPPAPTTPSHDPTQSSEYNLATTWAATYLQSTIPSPTSKAPSRVRATIPHLRAYHMWHEQKLSLDDVARHLRDPPLSHSTVSSYIMQAITLEKLGYGKEEMKVLISGMPMALRLGRWRWMAEKVGALG